jgi:GAF domain-containing protein
MTLHSSGRQQEGLPSDPHARQLEAVHGVSREITRELDLVRLLELITRRATELVGGSSGGIYLWDEAAQMLSPHAYYGPGAERMRFPRRLGEGLTGHVAQERRGIIANDYRSSPYAHPRTLQSTTLTAAIVEPLLFRDRLLGVIAVHHEVAGSIFSEAEQKILRLFAPQAAIAIENARLHSMAISRAAQLATMNELTRTLSTTLESAQVVQKTLAAIQVLFPDCVAEFLELTADGEWLRLVDIVGLRAGRRLVRSEFRVKAGLVGLAAATRQPVTSPDVAQDPRFINKTWAAEEGVVSAIVLPLIHQNKLHGVLSVLMRTPYQFAQEEMDLVYSFAVHASIAIENARLYEATRRRAEHFALLNDIARTLTTTLDPRQVAEQILKAVRDLIPDALVRLWEHGPEEGLFATWRRSA